MSETSLIGFKEYMAKYFIQSREFFKNTLYPETLQLWHVLPALKRSTYCLTYNINNFASNIY